MAAYECGTTDFPEPYPESIVCPEQSPETKAVITYVHRHFICDFFYYYYFSIWAIMSKVRIEAFCWGAGTALGELPPYFMARAHRLSGYDSDEEEDEYDELQEKIANQEEMVIIYLKTWQ